MTQQLTNSSDPSSSIAYKALMGGGKMAMAIAGGLATYVSDYFYSKKKEEPTTDLGKIEFSADPITPPIRNGYGDYVLMTTNGEAPETSVYEKVFPIINRFLPQVHQKPLADRLKTINDAIEEQFPDSHLKAVFLPRALYELCYLLKAYEEEFKLAKQDKYCPAYDVFEIDLAHPSKKTCCHSEVFEKGGDKNNLSEKAKILAAELNAFILAKIHLPSDGLTENQCEEAAIKILDQMNRLDKGKFVDSIQSNLDEYPIMNKIHRGMMIDSKNLKKAIALECSQEAENSIILYRGSRYTEEPLFEGDTRSVEPTPYCPCFGLSLFAGFIKDDSACAETRMFYDRSTRVSYALHISLQDKWQDAFDIPNVNTTCGLNARGEKFHARAKCLKPRGPKIGGYFGIVPPDMQARLISPLKQEELVKKLDAYQAKRIEFALDPKRKTGITK